MCPLPERSSDCTPKWASMGSTSRYSGHVSLPSPSSPPARAKRRACQALKALVCYITRQVATHRQRAKIRQRDPGVEVNVNLVILLPDRSHEVGHSVLSAGSSGSSRSRLIRWCDRRGHSIAKILVGLCDGPCAEGTQSWRWLVRPMLQAMLLGNRGLEHPNEVNLACSLRAAITRHTHIAATLRSLPRKT